MAEDVESCVQSALTKVCDRFGIQKLYQQQEEAIRCVVLDKKDVKQKPEIRYVFAGYLKPVQSQNSCIGWGKYFFGGNFLLQ